jgi:putative tryptophan/tyrosine transport system substrate-binding protein
MQHNPPHWLLRRGVHAVLAVVLVAGSPTLFAARQVQLVLSDSGDPYLGLADSLDSRVEADPEARRLRLIRVQADDDRPGRSDLAVAVGMKACGKVLAERTADASLCVLVPKAGFRRLAKETKGDRHSAIYLDQPIGRQLALAQVLLPEVSRVGMLAGPELSRNVAAIERTARAIGVEVELEHLDSTKDAAQGIQRLVKRNDLILAVYEPDVLTPSTAKWLLYMAHQGRVPVVGFSRAYVDAGAAAAVFSTPEQIGRQAAETILAWSRDGGGRLTPNAYPREFEVEVNRSVTKALGLDPPPNGELARRVAEIAGGAP